MYINANFCDCGTKTAKIKKISTFDLKKQPETPWDSLTRVWDNLKTDWDNQKKIRDNVVNPNLNLKFFTLDLTYDLKFTLRPQIRVPAENTCNIRPQISVPLH